MGLRKLKLHKHNAAVGRKEGIFAIVAAICRDSGIVDGVTAGLMIHSKHVVRTRAAF
tara:strand:+ start:287 stop:457 length:171 start_codon:yes stop_codon:yes gene_type:complete